MITGTNHFTGFKAAVSYYADYGFSESDVQKKVNSGEINLGPPPNKKFFIHKTEKRYFILD